MLNAKAIGEKIRNLRGTRSIRDVSIACGISDSALRMYEVGERIPRDEIKIKLAEYFNTSIEQLFFT